MNNSYAASRQQAMKGMKRSSATSKGLLSMADSYSQQSRRSSIDSYKSSTDSQRRSSIDSAFASLSLQDNDMEGEWGHFVDM